MLIAALGESGLTYAEVERRIGARKGWAKALLVGLIDGSRSDDTGIIRDIANFCTACGAEPSLGLRRIAPEPPAISNSQTQVE